jgi:hypothetical protein
MVVGEPLVLLCVRHVLSLSLFYCVRVMCWFCILVLLCVCVMCSFCILILLCARHVLIFEWLTQQHREATKYRIKIQCVDDNYPAEKKWRSATEFLSISVLPEDDPVVSKHVAPYFNMFYYVLSAVLIVLMTY